MYKAKQLLGKTTTLRDYDGQITKDLTIVHVLNKMTKASMP
ncbi:transposase [Klebsiella variicola]|nr:transposase [Klebsiella variicola]VUK57137.1 transposase [Klebsiella variicola]